MAATVISGAAHIKTGHATRGESLLFFHDRECLFERNLIYKGRDIFAQLLLIKISLAGERLCARVIIKRERSFCVWRGDIV